MTTWRKHGSTGLGDCWALAQWCLRESERTGEPTRLCLTFPAVNAQEPSRVPGLIQEIAGLLDSSGAIDLIAFQDGPSTLIPDRDLFGPHLPPPMRVRESLRWDGGSAGTVTFQFDGRSCAEVKNPPPEDVQRLVDTCGPRAVRLGRPMSLVAMVDALARCRLHVGVCSGVMHIAHAVDCPRLIVEYNMPVEPWHPARGWQRAYGTTHALHVIREMAA